MFHTLQYRRILWVVGTVLTAGQLVLAEPPAGYGLVWEDAFSGVTADLDANWNFQNGPSGHILCSRWRENAVVTNGFCRETNAICHSQAPVLLSSAVMKWAGPVTDKIDGTAMEVDYVRVYQRR